MCGVYAISVHVDGISRGVVTGPMVSAGWLSDATVMMMMVPVGRPMKVPLGQGSATSDG